MISISPHCRAALTTSTEMKNKKPTMTPSYYSYKNMMQAEEKSKYRDLIETKIETVFPETGFSAHPGIVAKNYNLHRSSWHSGRHKPLLPGTYEWLKNKKIIYAQWDGNRWLKNGRETKPPQEWRGLAFDPSVPHIAYVDPPGALLPSISMGGYVEHFEPEFPKVRMIHVARPNTSKDGDPLTMCGHKARPGSALRLWCDTERIKVVDGYQPELCGICISKTFDPNKFWVKRTNIPKSKPVIPPIPQSEGEEIPFISLPDRTSSFKEKNISPTLDNGPTPCYTGWINYSNWHTSSRATRFELLSNDSIELEITSKVDEDLSPTVLKATATRSSRFVPYTTGMVQLKTLDGGLHPYGKSEFIFSIIHLDEQLVKIEGTWEDEYGGNVTYPFISSLARLVE